MLATRASMTNWTNVVFMGSGLRPAACPRIAAEVPCKGWSGHGPRKRPVGASSAPASHGSRRGGFSRRNRGGERRAHRPCALRHAASTQATSVGFPRRPPESRSGGRGSHRSPAPWRRGNPCGPVSWAGRCVEAWLLTQADGPRAGGSRRPTSPVWRLIGTAPGRLCDLFVAISGGDLRFRHIAEDEKGRALPPGLRSSYDLGVIRPAGLQPWPSSGSCRGRARSG